jgi:hypothetical protein
VPEAETGALDDPQLAINWPLLPQGLSDRDLALPWLEQEIFSRSIGGSRCTVLAKAVLQQAGPAAYYDLVCENGVSGLRVVLDTNMML